jgi:hypothetical protein
MRTRTPLVVATLLAALILGVRPALATQPLLLRAMAPTAEPAHEGEAPPSPLGAASYPQ